jgi:hypothetical protein
MKIRIPVEQVRVGDIDPKTGKRVVEVLHRDFVQYVRAVLEGGWPIIDGYYGTIVEVERRESVESQV